MRIAAMMLLLMLTACATAPTPRTLAVARYSELQPGISTYADAVSIMGLPTGGAPMPGGALGAIWIGTPGTFAAPTVTLVFGPDGRLQRIAQVVGL